MPDQVGDGPQDPLQVLDELTPMRETLLGIVNVFVADGFTHKQARDLAVHVFVLATANSPDKED